MGRRLAAGRTDIRSGRRPQYPAPSISYAVCYTIRGATGAGGGEMTTPTNDGVQEVVRAKRFELVDDDGVVRGEMAVGYNGPALILYNSNGVAQLTASVTENGIPNLYLTDKAGNFRLTVALGDFGYGQLIMVGRDGAFRLDIRLNNEGNPRISMRDENDIERLAAWVNEDGSPYLGLREQEDTTRRL